MKSPVRSSGGNKHSYMPADVGVPTPPTDPEWAAVVASWPDLPPAVRAGIVAMVKAATK